MSRYLICRMLTVTKIPQQKVGQNWRLCSKHNNSDAEKTWGKFWKEQSDLQVVHYSHSNIPTLHDLDKWGPLTINLTQRVIQALASSTMTALLVQAIKIAMDLKKKLVDDNLLNVQQVWSLQSHMLVFCWVDLQGKQYCSQAHSCPRIPAISGNGNYATRFGCYQ